MQEVHIARLPGPGAVLPTRGHLVDKAKQNRKEQGVVKVDFNSWLAGVTLDPNTGTGRKIEEKY